MISPDTFTNRKCTKCGGSIMLRSDVASNMYWSCIQCGWSKEIDSMLYSKTKSDIVKKMNQHPDGLGGYIRGLLN